jgi:hypothetical protein
MHTLITHDSVFDSGEGRPDRLPSVLLWLLTTTGFAQKVGLPPPLPGLFTLYSCYPGLTPGLSLFRSYASDLAREASVVTSHEACTKTSVAPSGLIALVGS